MWEKIGLKVITMGITAPEYWEYQKRKAAAQTEEALGFIGSIFGFIGFLASMGMQNMGLLLFSIIIGLGGIIALLDGNEKMKKLKHVYWTKQAIREYEESRSRVLNRLTDEAGIEPETKSVEVEIIPEDSSFQREKILKLLEKLDERVSTGDITEATYKELKSKYEEKLRQTEDAIAQRIQKQKTEEIIRISDTKANIENEIKNLSSEISQAESEKALKMKNLEELKARHLIGQITAEDYESRRTIIEKEIQEINTQISSKEEKIRRFQETI
jgi:hypothetical protein